MIIHLPAVYLLHGCTSGCTLNGSKKFGGHLHLLYTLQSYLFCAKHWVLNSLQQYTNICSRWVMDQAWSPCLPHPGWSSTGSSFAELAAGKPPKKVPYQMMKLLWADRLPSPSLPLLLLAAGQCAALCLQFWEGMQERAPSSCPWLCSPSVSCPLEKGTSDVFVWQPSAAVPYKQHPLPPVCPLWWPFSMWTWLSFLPSTLLGNSIVDHRRAAVHSHLIHLTCM